MYFPVAHLISAFDRRAARQSLWLSTILATQLLIALMQLTITVRILDPISLGALFTIIAFTSLIFGLLTLPGEEVIVTHVTSSLVKGEHEDAARILRYSLVVALGMRLVGYGMIVLVAPVIGTLLAGRPAEWSPAFFDVTPIPDGDPVGVKVDYVTPTLVYALSGILSSMTGECLAVLRLTDRLHLGFAAAVSGALVRVGVLTTALATGGGLLMVALAAVAGNGVIGVGLFLAMLRSVRRAGLSGCLRSLSVTVPYDVIRFQFSNFWRSAVDALNRHLDVLLIVGLTSVVELAFYRTVHYIIDTTRLILETIGQGIQNEYSRLWASSNGAAIRKLACRFTTLAVVLGALGYGVLATFHKSVLRVVLGPEFAAAAGPLLIMIPGGFAFACVAAVYTLPAATGRAVPHLVSISAALVVQVVVMVVLVPTYGAYGAAWANTIYFLVFAAVMLAFTFATLKRISRLPAVD